MWNNTPARKIVIHFENPAFSATQKTGNKNNPTRIASRIKFI
jgi:hypothetical protein